MNEIKMICDAETNDITDKEYMDTSQEMNKPIISRRISLKISLKLRFLTSYKSNKNKHF